MELLFLYAKKSKSVHYANPESILLISTEGNWWLVSNYSENAYLCKYLKRLKNQKYNHTIFWSICVVWHDRKLTNTPILAIFILNQKDSTCNSLNMCSISIKAVSVWWSGCTQSHSSISSVRLMKNPKWHTQYSFT